MSSQREVSHRDTETQRFSVSLSSSLTLSSFDSRGLQDLDRRRQTLRIGIGGLLNLPDDIHALDDAPESCEPLPAPPKSSEG